MATSKTLQDSFHKELKMRPMWFRDTLVLQSVRTMQPSWIYFSVSQ